MGNVQQSGGRLWPVGVALAAGGGDGGRPVARARRPGDGDGQRRPSCGRPSPEDLVVATEMGNVQQSGGRLWPVGVAPAAGWGDGSGLSPGHVVLATEMGNASRAADDRRPNTSPGQRTRATWAGLSPEHVVLATEMG